MLEHKSSRNTFVAGATAELCSVLLDEDQGLFCFTCHVRVVRFYDSLLVIPCSLLPPGPLFFRPPTLFFNDPVLFLPFFKPCFLEPLVFHPPHLFLDLPTLFHVTSPSCCVNLSPSSSKPTPCFFLSFHLVFSTPTSVF